MLQRRRTQTIRRKRKKKKIWKITPETYTFCTNETNLKKKKKPNCIFFLRQLKSLMLICWLLIFCDFYQRRTRHQVVSFAFLSNGTWDPHICMFIYEMYLPHKRFAVAFFSRFASWFFFCLCVCCVSLLNRHSVSLFGQNNFHTTMNISEKFSPCHKQAYGTAFWFDSIVICLNFHCQVTV